MKKKGLIIATIVMVLVLAVSLTTATYAWFTVTNETTVEPINFAVTSDAAVLIGLKIDNTYNSAAKETDFVYGTTSVASAFAGENAAIPTANSKYWESAENTAGLGNKIELQLELDDMKKAVGSGKVGVSAGALDFASLRTAASDSATGPVQASGENSIVHGDTVERAIAQEHYVDVVIGVKPNQSDLTSITCYVVVNPTAGGDLGINAAIHVAWKIDGDITQSQDGNQDIYGTNKYDTILSTLNTSLAQGAANMGEFGGSEEATLNPGAVALPITIATAGDGAVLSRGTTYQLHLVIWIDGEDGDARSSALNVASDIYVSFAAERKAGQEG